MTAYSKPARYSLSLIMALTILVSSCGTKPTNLVPTSTSGQSFIMAPLATPNGSARFEAGFRYADAAEDAPLSFLDAVAFQAVVDEAKDEVEFVIQLHDLPPTVEYDQVSAGDQVTWVFYVFLDPAQMLPESNSDFYLILNPDGRNLRATAIANQKNTTPGDPVMVPIDLLWALKAVYNSRGFPISTPHVRADMEANTITIRGKVPGITSNAVFSFVTHLDANVADRPDNYRPPDPAALATPQLEGTPAPINTDPTRLVPIGNVRAYPGPAHYEGDVLTIEILSFDGIPDTEQETILRLDQGEPREVTGLWSVYNELIIPLALDTSGLTGIHTLYISTSDGLINEAYTFEVLPASQRPANEATATWQTYATQCCTFHYLSGTAAARDIDFIATHFQQGADNLSAFIGDEVTSELDVYLIDRLWGNGGFGGGGLIVASYTDRYYGPTVDGIGLETLARHELSHVTTIGGTGSGDGVEFNYEGLAVYVAGGHYKPEPLAERAAALYDLGYYAPVEELLWQHELNYLHGAAALVYIEETYGQEAVWKFLWADNDTTDDQPGNLEAAIQSTFELSLAEFNAGFQKWMEGNTPGDQLDDLRLTIELQDLRRQYQDTYAPPPMIILSDIENTIRAPEYTALIMREPTRPANVTFELIVARAQQALVDGDYSETERLVSVLQNILETETFEVPLAADYFAITTLLLAEGFDVDDLVIQDDRTAQAVVFTNGLDQQIVQLQKNANEWEISP